jgi:hypothetical protein
VKMAVVRLHFSLGPELPVFQKFSASLLRHTEISRGSI